MTRTCDFAAEALHVWKLTPPEGEVAPDCSFFVAASEQEARLEYRRLLLHWADTAEVLPDDMELEIQFDDLPSGRDRFIKTCREWATEEHRGLLASDI